MFTKVRRALAAMLLILCVGFWGCETGMEPGPSDPNTPGDEMPDPKPEPDPKPDPEPEPEPSIVGIWQVESGSIFAGLDTIAFVRAMTLNDDGTGRIFLQDRNTEFPNCVEIEFLYDDDALLLDLVALNNPLATFVYPIVILEDDTMTIAGQNNPRTKFRRIQELPAEYMCRQSRPVRRFTDLPVPGSDLAYLDGTLHYTSYTDGMALMIESVDAETGALGMPVAAGARPIVHTAQPDGLWGTCQCGANTDSMLTMPGGMGPTDTMDTDDFDKPISIEQMAYDAAAEELWVYGWSEALGHIFLQVDAKAEPDVLIDNMAFDAYMTGLAAYEGNLWVLATVLTQSIVRIDPATGEIVASYDVPADAQTWTGLTFDNAGRLFLVGETPDEKGVMVEVALE